jgi:hypothetical protein
MPRNHDFATHRLMRQLITVGSVRSGPANLFDVAENVPPAPDSARPSAYSVNKARSLNYPLLQAN